MVFNYARHRVLSSYRSVDVSQQLWATIGISLDQPRLSWNSVAGDFNSRYKNAIFKCNTLMSADIFHSHMQQAVFRRYQGSVRFATQKNSREVSPGFCRIAKSHVAYVTQDVSPCGSTQHIFRRNADDARREAKNYNDCIGARISTGIPEIK